MTGNRASSNEAPQLYQELWISLASLVQSYAAAAMIAMPGESCECSRDAQGGVSVQAGNRRLTVSRLGTAGEGRWLVESSEREILASGELSLDEQGLVSLDGNAPTEMDAAAEILTAKIL